MTAPLCTVCLNTGSKSQFAGGELDCVACNAASERAAMNRAIEQRKNELTGEYRLSTFSAEWFAYQLGKAAAAPVTTDSGSDPVQFQAGVIEGYERSAKALGERAVGWRQDGDHDLAEEVLQCRSMLHDQKPAIVQPSYQDLLDTLQQVTNEREEARGNARHLREEVKKAMTLVEAVEYLRAVEQRRQERRERLGLDHPIKLFQIWMSDMGQSCEWIGDDQFSGFVNQGKYEAFHAGFEIGQQTAGAAAPVVPVAAQPVVQQEPVLWHDASAAPHEDQGSLPTSQGEARQIAILGSTKGPFGAYTTPLYANLQHANIKPIAWGLMAICDPEVTVDPELADYWKRKGRDVTDLYAAPHIEAQPAEEVARRPNMDDWNVQMACVKALLSATDGELECMGVNLLDTYIEDVKRVVSAAMAQGDKA